MTQLLVAGLVVLTIFIIGLIWAWIGSIPATKQYRRYSAMATDRSLRNRAWDAAVARSHDRNHL
jgi:hypothetical protein